MAATPSSTEARQSSGSNNLLDVNIVHVTPVYKPVAGGLGNVVHNLAQTTSLNTRAKVKVLFGDDDWSKREKKCTRDGMVEVVHIRTVKIWFVRIPFGMASHLAKADVIHIHDAFFSLVALAAVLLAKRGAKVILSTHGGFFHTKRWMPLKILYFNSVCRIVSTALTAIVAVSRQDLQRFRTISKRVVLIENGVEIEKFADDGRLVRENRFLFVGKLAYNKNIERLTDVYMKLREVRTDIALDIVGEDIVGVWEKISQKLASDPSYPGFQINYHGSLDDAALLKLMKRAKFFILASNFEGFGIAVVEAMAAGRIPIVSDIASMRELITDNQNGFLVDFSNVERAASHIQEILNYPPSHLERIAAAARVASQRFSWNVVGNTYIELYEKCLFGLGKMGADRAVGSSGAVTRT
jgi:alpha-1,3-mannosyltransferase